MCPFLDVNFGDVPDEYEVPSPGRYRLEITKVPELKEAKSGTGQNLIVTSTIISDGKFKGRTITDMIFLNDFGKVKVKQLAKACGVILGSAGLNTEEMLGHQYEAAVSNRDYVDDSGEKRKAANTSKYIMPI